LEGPPFHVMPAIDLRGGRVVRLQEGDFDRERTYADDPIGVAADFARAGAEWIHVVDLDGARDGERRHAAVITAIRSSLPPGIRLQIGGGIRSVEALAGALADGADRVVLGTSALEDPDLVGRAIERHGADRIAVALDVRGGRAVGHGWVGGGPDAAIVDVLSELEVRGVRLLVVTAIDRDGMLGGPDLGLLESIIGGTRADVIASGGIATIDELRATKAVGCRGAIVGRAIYDGRIDLQEALAAFD